MIQTVEKYFSHTHFFSIAENRQISSLLVARIVSDRQPRCTIGRISPAYNSKMDCLDGRLGQVIQDFSLSETKSKTDASSENDGILLLSLVDNYRRGDEILNTYLIDIDSDEEDDEL